MVVLDGNFALGCGPGTDYPQNTYISVYAKTNDVLELITFVLSYPHCISRQGLRKMSGNISIAITQCVKGGTAILRALYTYTRSVAEL